MFKTVQYTVCCWYSIFCFSVCFQTLCCTAWAVSTFWFYTGSCSLTHCCWTGRPCRLQVTHTNQAQRYTLMSTLYKLYLSFQMKCLCFSDFLCSPVLSTFPLLLDQPDLLDALRVRCKEMKFLISFNAQIFRLQLIFFFCAKLKLVSFRVLGLMLRTTWADPRRSVFVGVIPEYTCRGCWKY